MRGKHNSLLGVFLGQFYPFYPLLRGEDIEDFLEKSGPMLEAAFAHGLSLGLVLGCFGFDSLTIE